MPAMAVAVLSFCSEPRDENDVLRALGPQGAQLYRGLAEVGLLVSPEDAHDTPLFFGNFASLDIHRRMLADQPRVDRYRDAIQSVVKNGDVVIDAGTGSGVLAALAAQAGAARVYALDNSEIIDVAQQVARRSGLDAIQTVRADFGSVALPERADVLVTETFGAFALAEGAAADLRACVDRNLKETGRVIPCGLSLHLAPVLDRRVIDEVFSPMSRLDGIDLSPLIEAAWKRGISMCIPPEALGQSQCLVDLAWPCADVVSSEVSWQFDEPTEVFGLCGWFDLAMSASVTLSTGPSAAPTHWAQVLFPWPSRNVTRLEGVVTVRPADDDRRSLEVEGKWVDSPPTFHRIR
jgi:hypothetical protein